LDSGDVPDDAGASLDGAAVGNLLYADPTGRFHILGVVFPEGTSSGVHHHGCWGVIGYLRGGDEETRYAGQDAPHEHDTAELAEAVQGALGKHAVAWRKPHAGITPAQRFVVSFADGTSAFVKAPVDTMTADWSRMEHHVLSQLEGDFMPRVLHASETLLI